MFITVLVAWTDLAPWQPVSDVTTPFSEAFEASEMRQLHFLRLLKPSLSRLTDLLFNITVAVVFCAYSCFPQLTHKTGKIRSGRCLHQHVSLILDGEE
jgi:hypothetical protein